MNKFIEIFTFSELALSLFVLRSIVLLGITALLFAFQPSFIAVISPD